MATEFMDARQPRRKFPSCQKSSGHTGEGAEVGGVAHTGQDGYGSIAQGCFFPRLERNLKGSIHHKRSTALHTYLHINAPQDSHLSTLAFQKPERKSKSKQCLTNESLDPYLSALAFQKQKSKKKQAQPIEQTHNSEHEEIKDVIHFDPQGTTFTSADHGIKSTSLASLFNQETKNEVCWLQPPQHISSIDTSEKSPSLIQGSEQLSGGVVCANQAGSKRQSKAVSGIHELMLSVIQYSLGLEASPLTSSDDDKHISSRSPQFNIPNLGMRSTNPRPIFNVQVSDDLLHQESINQSFFESNPLHHTQLYNVDSVLSSLAAHVFSMRDKMMRGGYEDLKRNYPFLRHGVHANFKNCCGNGDAYNVEKAMAGLIDLAQKLEDLADLEEFLQCYMRLSSPCFLSMVNHILCELCDDIFKCKGLDPFTHNT